MITRMMFARAIVGMAVAGVLLAEVHGCRTPLDSERAKALSAAELQEYAKDGDATAQFNLGRCYYNGEGVAMDRSEAARWFRKAAEQGYLPAQEALKILQAPE